MRDGGASLVGLLAVLVVLGGVSAAVVVTETSSPGGQNRVPTGRGSTLNASPSGAGGDIAAAAATVCRTDYEAVSQAEDEYQTMNGRPASGMSDVAQYLRDPVTSRYFTITVVSGKVEVATPGHPATVGEGNCAFAGT
jgi:hypothetical protein